MWRIVVLTLLISAMVVPAQVVAAGDNVGIDHITTTYTGTEDLDYPWRMAEIVCCHCVSYLSNGTRFYHGVIPISTCRAQKGHCEGEAKCFP